MSKVLKAARRPVALMAAVCLSCFAGVAYMTTMPGEPSKTLSVDLDATGVATHDALKRHVEFLASAPRNRRDAPEHERAVVEYIERELRSYGFAPVRQVVPTAEGDFHNIIVRIDGTSSPDEVVVLGAHWDTRGPTPGADDNASGVAALLELSRWLATQRAKRSLELVFWANEEPPYFRTEQMGSLVHARSLRAANVNVVWALSLEMLGYYDPSEGAQRYPAAISPFYPNHGAFIAFVGSMWHRDAVTVPVAVMREKTTFPTYGFAGPEQMTGIGFSDHWSFWQVGYPAVMVTDTSFFRTPHYHQYSDTPDTLDWVRFPWLVVSLRDVVAHFAQL